MSNFHRKIMWVPGGEVEVGTGNQLERGLAKSRSHNEHSEGGTLGLLGKKCAGALCCCGPVV